MVSKYTLLENLPAYQKMGVVIKDDQSTGDIMKEVINAHYYFADQYDKICNYFLKDSDLKTIKGLFDFCKENLTYEVETEDDQTTKSPAAILREKKSDCKHFSSFIGGNLAALNREGIKIKWWYRFASYKIFDEQPGHVFIVCEIDGKEIWVDPVLNSFNDKNLRPSYWIDKKINSKKMLQRISGTEVDYTILKNAVTILAGYNVMRANGFNMSEYLRQLKILPQAQKVALRNSYVYFMKYAEKSNSIGQIVEIIGLAIGLGEEIFGKKSTPTPAPVVVPPAPTSTTLEQYLPLILIAGLGVFAFIELK